MKLAQSLSREILEHIEDSARADDNLAIYFNNSRGRADIVTHSTIMELFSKLERNSKSVEFMKVWLIEQRGISGWGASNLTGE